MRAARLSRIRQPVGFPADWDQRERRFEPDGPFPLDVKRALRTFRAPGGIYDARSLKPDFEVLDSTDGRRRGMNKLVLRFSI
jgi:hypothetical protein